MGLFKENFHWSILLSFTVLGWTTMAVLAVAGILLIFDQFLGANVCFVIVAVFFFAKVVELAVRSGDTIPVRIVFTFLLCGVVGVAITETVRGVNRFALKRKAREEVAKAAPLTPSPRPAAQNAKPETPDFYRSPVRITPPHKPPTKPAAENLEHPVLLVAKAPVTRDEANHKVSFVLPLTNVSAFETVAEVRVRLYSAGVEVPVITKNPGNLLNDRTMAIQANGGLVELSSWVQFSDVDDKRFKDNEISVKLSLIAEYPDKGGKTRYTWEGVIETGSEHVNVTKSMWEPIKQP